MSDEDNIPEKVYFNDNMFFDEKGRTKGAKFFDEWKDRRGEFPTTIEAIGGERPPKVSRRPPRTADVVPLKAPVELRPVEDAPPRAALKDGPTYMDIATQRKAFFDAYVEVGFTREEALELCVK